MFSFKWYGSMWELTLADADLFPASRGIPTAVPNIDALGLWNECVYVDFTVYLATVSDIEGNEPSEVYLLPAVTGARCWLDASDQRVEHEFEVVVGIGAQDWGS